MAGSGFPKWNVQSDGGSGFPAWPCYSKILHIFLGVTDNLYLSFLIMYIYTSFIDFSPKKSIIYTDADARCSLNCCPILWAMPCWAPWAVRFEVSYRTEDVTE